MSISMDRSNIFKMNQKYKVLSFSDIKKTTDFDTDEMIFLLHIKMSTIQKKYSVQMNLQKTKLTLFWKNCNYVIL